MMRQCARTLIRNATSVGRGVCAANAGAGSQAVRTLATRTCVAGSGGGAGSMGLALLGAGLFASTLGIQEAQAGAAPNTERTFIALKPDCIYRGGLIAEIMGR